MQNLIRKLNGSKLLGRRRWKDNIKTKILLKNIMGECRHYSLGPAKKSAAGHCDHGNYPSLDFLSSRVTVGLKSAHSSSLLT
jgi:hypothetical protein